MARPKNQAERRRQISEATRRAVVAHGAEGLRLRNIADEAGLSAGSVLYYYPDVATLLTEVYEHAVERFSSRRQAAAEAMADPAGRLAATIDAGLATGPEDEEVHLLHIAVGFFESHPVIRVIDRTLFDRQVAMYQMVLETGVAAGAFTLSDPSLVVARNLVALEDSYNLHIVTGNPAIPRAQALRLVTSYARLAVGCTLPVPA